MSSGNAEKVQLYSTADVSKMFLQTNVYTNKINSQVSTNKELKLWLSVIYQQVVRIPTFSFSSDL